MTCSGTGQGPSLVGQTTRKVSRVVSDVPADARAWRAEFHDPADFDRARHGSRVPNVELVADTGWLSEPVASLPAGLGIATKAGERIVGVRVQQLRSHESSVVLRTRKRAVVLHFAGNPPRMQAADLRLLKHRLTLAGVAGVTAACLSIWLLIRYLGRSEWFFEHGHPFALFVSLALVSFGVWTGVLGLTLARPSHVHTKGPLVAIGSGLVGVLAAWMSASPSVATAALALERGDLERASVELQALVEVEPDADGVAELREQLDAARGREADDQREARLASQGLEGDAKVLRERWHEGSRRQAALEDHLAALREQIEDAWTRQDVAAMELARTSAWDLSEALEHVAKALGKLIEVRTAIAKPDLEVALERFGEAADLDAVRERRETVKAELIAALAAAARAKCESGRDGALSRSSRISALEMCKRLEGSHRKLAEADIEGIDVDELDARLARERKQLEVEQAAERRKQEAAERRKQSAKKSSSSNRSSRDDFEDYGGGGGGCCKVCSTGIPCGDSCISANKTCRKPRGCAC